jgi:hypothetical protein
VILDKAFEHNDDTDRVWITADKRWHLHGFDLDNDELAVYLSPKGTNEPNRIKFAAQCLM